MSRATQPGPGVRFLRFLGRLTKALFVVLFILVVAVSIAAGIVVGRQLLLNDQALRQELSRQGRTTDLLRSDVNNLMEGNPPNQQAQIERQATAVARLTTGMRELSGRLDEQATRLAALDEQVAQISGRSELSQQGISDLGAALSALQGDINDNGRRLDELGGQVDTLEAELAAVAEQAAQTEAGLAEPQASVAQMRQALTIFRLWELLARIQLRLAEQNFGLAATDAQAALAEVERLIDTSPAGIGAGLGPVRNRLLLVVDSLPADPVTAARDVDIAWTDVDRLLDALLAPTSPAGEAPPLTVTAVPTATVPAQPAGTPVPAPTATP